MIYNELKNSVDYEIQPWPFSQSDRTTVSHTWNVIDLIGGNVTHNQSYMR